MSWSFRIYSGMLVALTITLSLRPYLIGIPDTAIQSISISDEENPNENEYSIEIRKLSRDSLNTSDARTFTAKQECLFIDGCLGFRLCNSFTVVDVGHHTGGNEFCMEMIDPRANASTMALINPMVVVESA
jgi:hypothetical protein